MVAYALLLPIVIGVLAWAIYKTLSMLFLKPEAKPQTVADKQEELSKLKKTADNLKDEVDVTNKLVSADTEVKVLKSRLEEAESKRSE